MPAPYKRNPVKSFDRPEIEEYIRDQVDSHVPQGLMFGRVVNQYSFTVLSPEIQQKLKELGPLLDVGCGNGYWTKRLEDLGVDIEGIEPRQDASCPVFASIKGDHRLVVDFPDRALLMIWPTKGNDWAAEAVDLYEGNTVAYIGDPRYQETANVNLALALKRKGFKRQSVDFVDSWLDFARDDYFRDTLMIFKR